MTSLLTVPLHAIGRSAVVLVSPCLALMALLAHASAIYTTQTNVATSASLDFSDATPLERLIVDLPVTWRVDGPLFSEPNSSGFQLEYLTIAGIQHSTGLDFGLNECHYMAEGRSCSAVDNGLLDFTLAWSPEDQPLRSAAPRSNGGERRAETWVLGDRAP
jgi:hypothetical protein